MAKQPCSAGKFVVAPRGAGWCVWKKTSFGLPRIVSKHKTESAAIKEAARRVVAESSSDKPTKE